ncbi:MAG: SDR family oxidoreductase [Rhizobiaceae bacterium]|nr:SDR family oxidoreductase [Rhizobiaceae bacterium]
MSHPSLKGRVAVVSGAGAGIGRGIATRLLEDGVRLVISDIDATRVEDAVRDLSKIGEVVGLKADAASNQGIDATFDKAISTFGSLDILVNNAGVPDYWKTMLEVTDEFWDRHLGINLSGPFKACRAVVPIMIKQGKGVIINVASISGFRGGRSGFAYTVAKHGVIGLTRAVAIEYGEAGVRCNCISPGSVVTSLSSMDGMSEEGLKIREKGIVTRPPRAEPGDVAPAVAFLASDDSRYVNGTNLIIDAGWTAW